MSHAPGSPGSLPRTPEAYVQGQQGRYGPGPVAGVQQMSPIVANGPQNMPPGPASFAGGGPGMGMPPGGPGMGNGPQMFVAPPPTQRPGPPMRPGAPMGPATSMPGGPASFPPQGPNSFNQSNFSMNGGMGGITAPPAPLPGTFDRSRYIGNDSPRDNQRNSRERINDGRPGKDPRGGRGKKKRRVPIWARVVIGFLAVMIVLAGGGLLYYQINFAGSVNTIVGQQVARAKNEENPNTNLTNGILTGPRVNILLLGSDTDQKFQGTYIAQTDIVVTIDPASQTVGMLSIPRDFFIPVPGAGMHKLDEAYGLGGVALSRETIEQDFGIPINYYAWVGLDGFIKVINEVGGVDVDVTHPIVDDNYPDDVGKMANDPYAVKRLYLSPGPQHLDGPTALEYVRSRHADLVGDFGRSVRQQQVLGALKTKLSNPDIFNKLPAIAGDLKGFLKTDMALPDVLKLMNFARSLNMNKINKLTLGPPYSSGGTAPAGGNDAGADVVIPNCAKIIPAIQQMLQLGSNATCPNMNGSVTPTTTLPLAYTSGKISAQAYAPTSSTANLSSLFSLAGAGTSGSSGDPSDLFGVQGLLDLMLMGIFESPNVF